MILCFVCFSVSLLATSCLAGPPQPIVEKFIEKCATGDWSGAEMSLSERGKLLYTKDKTLQDTFWPMLGLGVASGITPDVIKSKFSQYVIMVSSDSSTDTGQVRVKINNSILLGETLAKTILDQTGLKSIDVNVKFDLVQEMGRWKIEKINPQLDPIELSKWENFSRKSPPRS